MLKPRRKTFDSKCFCALYFLNLTFKFIILIQTVYFYYYYYYSCDKISVTKLFVKLKIKNNFFAILIKHANT